MRRQIPKLDVAGSVPVVHSFWSRLCAASERDPRRVGHGYGKLESQPPRCHVTGD